MFKGLWDLAGLVKNARDIQQKVEELKASLAEVTAEGVSGGGLVRVRGKGDGTILSVEIDEQTVRDGDVEMLQDLVLAAINNYNQKLSELRREKITELTGGLLPPGFDLGL